MRTLILLANVLDAFVFGILLNKYAWAIGIFIALIIISRNQ